MVSSPFEEKTWIKYTTDPNQLKKNINERFDKLVERADNYYGHQEGYSGEINSKDSWKLVGNYTKSQYIRISTNPQSKIAKDFRKIDAKHCDDAYAPACVVVIRNDTKTKKIKKTTGFSFSKLTKTENPYVVNQCDKWQIGEEFPTLNDAKNYIRSNKGKSFCQHPTITKVTHSVSVSPKTKEINQKYMRAVFFGMSPS